MVGKRRRHAATSNPTSPPPPAPPAPRASPSPRTSCAHSASPPPKPTPPFDSASDASPLSPKSTKPPPPPSSSTASSPSYVPHNPSPGQLRLNWSQNRYFANSPEPHQDRDIIATTPSPTHHSTAQQRHNKPMPIHPQTQPHKRQKKENHTTWIDLDRLGST